MEITACMLVCALLTYIVYRIQATGCRLWTLEHVFLRYLHKLFLASGPVNTGFKDPINGIDHPVLVNSKKEKEGRKISFPEKKGGGGEEEDSMWGRFTYDIDPPQICHIVRIPRGNGSDYSTKWGFDPLIFMRLFNCPCWNQTVLLVNNFVIIYGTCLL